MFNGIIETIGNVNEIKNKEGCKCFTITPQKPFTDLIIGESIAINGACLTVTDFTKENFAVTVVPETLRLTNLSQLTEGNQVNLERSMPLHGRISGHTVQGHVDAMGEILELNADDHALLAKISIPKNLNKYIVNKGYITLDGMSITVIQSTPEWFIVTFIPHTREVTIIKSHYKKGTNVNIEVDIIGKYIEKSLEGYIHASTYRKS